MRKKYLKQRKSIIMVLAMVFCIVASGISVMAAEPATKIRVTGIEEGANVYAYAIAIDAVDDNGNHYWKYNQSGSVKDRVEDGEISTVVPKNAPAGTLSDALYFYLNLNSQGGDGTNWDLHDGEGQAVVDKTVLSLSYNPDDKSYSVDNVKPGLYVIAVNKQNPTYSYNFTIVAVNYQYSSAGVASIADDNGVINVAVKKSGNPTLKKEVVENGTSKKYGDASIGDTVQFKITLTVPNYEGAWKTDNLHYSITDTLSAGLTLKTDSVLFNGTKIADKTWNNNKTAINTSGNGFTLNLYGQDVYQYAGDTIKIAYSATINDSAKVNFADEENKATIQYTTAANSTELSEPESDSTYHYTFGFDTLVNGTGSATTTEITKYGVKTTDESDNKVALGGAEFQIFKEGDSSPLHFTSDGKFTTDTSQQKHIVSKNDGRLTVTGLDAGTYILKESKAPYGYALDKTTYQIVISPTYNELTGKLKNYKVSVNNGSGTGITFTHEKLDNGSIKTTDSVANADTFGINNTPLLTLPETGGVGIIVLTVVAVVMMAGFGCMFIWLRKGKRA